MASCSSCGTQLNPDASFCSSCGRQVLKLSENKDKESDSSMRFKSIAEDFTYKKSLAAGFTSAACFLLFGSMLTDVPSLFLFCALLCLTTCSVSGILAKSNDGSKRGRKTGLIGLAICIVLTIIIRLCPSLLNMIPAPVCTIVMILIGLCNGITIGIVDKKNIALHILTALLVYSVGGFILAGLTNSIGDMEIILVLLFFTVVPSVYVFTYPLVAKFLK